MEDVMRPDVHIAKDVKLGKNVVFHGFANCYGCAIGDNTRIGTFVEIQKNASIGPNCKIQSHSFICEGVTIEEGVFIGHHVSFINDKYPTAVNPDMSLQTENDWKVIPTTVRKKASVGSGSTILCGVTIGEGSLIGAGTVLTKSVPPGEVWTGNPAKFVRKNV